MRFEAKGGEVEIPERVIESYRVLYANADECFAKMTIWLATNKSRRPAKPLVFIAAWFKRAGIAHRKQTFVQANRNNVMQGIFGQRRMETINVEPTQRLG